MKIYRYCGYCNYSVFLENHQISDMYDITLYIFSLLGVYQVFHDIEKVKQESITLEKGVTAAQDKSISCPKFVPDITYSYFFLSKKQIKIKVKKEDQYEQYIWYY